MCHKGLKKANNSKLFTSVYLKDRCRLPGPEDGESPRNASDSLLSLLSGFFLLSSPLTLSDSPPKLMACQLFRQPAGGEKEMKNKKFLRPLCLST